MNHLISVIVPVYNGQDYLEKCIESIEAQDYDYLEVIIINDGSTDDTASVCVRLRQRYSNVRVINMEDRGVSAARNAGLDAARGTYVTFVDADDRLRPKMLKVLYNSILETGSDVAGCGFLPWGKEEEWQKLLISGYHINKAVKYTPSVYLKEQLLNGNSRCWSKLYRRAAIGNLRFQEGLSIGEDMLFLVRLLPYIRSIAETDYPGYGYYQNPKGAMNRKFSKHYMDQITCWELAREEILKIDQKLNDQVTMILIMGILLTVGKLASLPLKERKQMKQYVRICYDKLEKEIRTAGAYEGLSRGYKIKTKLFLYVPQLYLYLYHMRGK
ncbi:MAG: glycosyltransferase [Lachnospiraceae bacterium]|nr:glycosyltransferase [Lachnospiraceae bacterium]